MLPAFALAFLLQAPVPAVEGCTVEGAVYSASGGAPLKKTAVVLRRVENRRGRTYGAVTDTSGSFALRSVEPGKYRLSAERTGFARTEYGAQKPGGTGSILTLEPGCALRDLAIRLIATPVVAGRVFDRDGDPVAHARLALYGARIAEGRRQLYSAGAASTNDLGEYRIFGMVPGRYYVQATYSNPLRNQGLDTGGESVAPTYYPRATDIAAAVPLELAAGQEMRSIDITLLPVRTVRVRGKLSSGGRGSHAYLSPRGVGFDRQMGAPRAMVDGEGRFEIREVVPGSYELVATTNLNGKQLTARLPVDAGATDVEGLSLTMIPPSDVTATLQVEEPLRISDVARADVRLGTRSGPASRFVQGRAQKDGPVIFKDLEAGEYEVSAVNLPEDVYLAGARAGGADLFETGVDLRRGPLPGPVELTFSPAGGRITGIILDEKGAPAAEAYAVLVPDGKLRSRTGLYRTAVAGSAGRYEIRGVTPGSYTLFAWESLDSAAYREADFLAKYETIGVSVKVEREGRETRDLKLTETR